MIGKESTRTHEVERDIFSKRDVQYLFEEKSMPKNQVVYRAIISYGKIKIERLSRKESEASLSSLLAKMQISHVDFRELLRRS